MLHNLLLKFLFSGMMMFAAGSTAISDALGGGGGDAGFDASSAGDGGSDAGLSVPGDAGAAEGDHRVSDGADLGADDHGDSQREEQEEPEVKEFKGAVSARLRAITKQAPELQQVFQKYPKIQEQIEATFRREAALREIFPTVAEARQFREHFPNGLQDVQQLLQDQSEVDQLDQLFYNRDREGNYSGHLELINNLYTDDREAAVNLFRTIPREWARLDRESYNQVMGQIFGATLAQRGVPDFIGDLLAQAKDAKQDGLAKGLERLLGWAEGYATEKRQPSEDEQRLSRERQNFQREREQTAREEGQRFNQTFVQSSRKLQLDIITNHPAIKRLEKVSSITPDKRARIAEEVRGRMEKLLSNSPSFMRKLKPAYQKRDMQECTSLQKAAWSQPWLLNKMVRDVLRVETPAMVEQNRESIRRRAGTNGNARPANNGAQTQQQSKTTGPYQVGNVWYKPDGKRYTMEEILAGKHQQS